MSQDSGSEKPTRAVIVDGHAAFRHGLKELLERELGVRVIGAVDCVADALALLEAELPDLALVDPTLAGDSGLELMRVIATRWPRLRTVAVSGNEAPRYAEAAARCGVAGYVMKHEPVPSMVAAIDRALTGPGS